MRKQKIMNSKRCFSSCTLTYRNETQQQQSLMLIVEENENQNIVSSKKRRKRSLEDVARISNSNYFKQVENYSSDSATTRMIDDVSKNESTTSEKASNNIIVSKTRTYIFNYNCDCVNSWLDVHNIEHRSW